MKRTITIRQALQNVADNPASTTDPIDTPVHELVCRELFTVANTPDAGRGAGARANKARKVLLDRLVGKRMPGSHPATKNKTAVELVDLTVAELPSEATS